MWFFVGGFFSTVFAVLFCISVVSATYFDIKEAEGKDGYEMQNSFMYFGMLWLGLSVLCTAWGTFTMAADIVAWVYYHVKPLIPSISGALNW